MRKFIFALTVLFTLPLLTGGVAHAATTDVAIGMQVRPLLYNETLQPNQIKKGFIDVSNPSKQTVTLDTSVQLFTQIDDQGSLKFYDADYVKTALVPDLKEFDLGPREAVRLYFTVNSSKLPDGDVLAGIFVTNKTTPHPLAITPAVRVGTLLIFQNGKPGPRNTAITDFNLPFFQFSNDIHGSVSIKNMADSNTQSGFFADVTLAVSPWGSSVKKQSPLITSGRTRQMDFDVPSDQIGFYKLTVTTGTATAYKWVFIVTGIWRTLIFTILSAIVILGLAIWFIIRRRRKHKK
ncbi:MAG: exported protein of unknown function [Candidatus Saccharibacteria bacterium]|nr:exported protein of unknown function [Candidatus Saccharibacteria bacterium]